MLSFLLVGHYAERATSRRAAMQALLVTTAGGLAMLVGIIVLGHTAGTYLLSELVAHPPSGTAASVGLALLLVGAVSKSALVPLHFWLPGAMAAPTPVSAYLHAAAMVKAGVYLVARLTPGFADAPPWRPTVVILGLAHPAARRLARGPRVRPEADPGVRHRQPTRVHHAAGRRRRRRPDARRAWRCCARTRCSRRRCSWSSASSTTPPAPATSAGWRGSAIECRPLFDHRRVCGGQHGRAAAVPRLRRQGGRLRDAGAQRRHSVRRRPVCWPRVVLGSVFTTIYSLRFLWGAFARKGRREPSSLVAAHAPAAGEFPCGPGCFGRRQPGAGPDAGPARRRARRLRRLRARRTTLPTVAVARVGLPLVLSAVVLAVGIGVFVAAGPLAARRGSVGCRWATPTAIYDAPCAASDMLSFRVTGATQRGSIPATQSVILSTLVLLPVARARARRPRPPAVRDCGIPRCSRWSGC